MANKVARIKERRHDEFSEAFKEATVEYDQKKGKESAADVCFRVGVKHNLSPKRQRKLTGRRIREAIVSIVFWPSRLHGETGLLGRKRSKKLPFRWRRPKPPMTPRGLPSA